MHIYHEYLSFILTSANIFSSYNLYSQFTSYIGIRKLASSIILSCQQSIGWKLPSSGV